MKDTACPHCQAWHFPKERLAASSKTNPRFGMCCLQGQVQLPKIKDAPIGLLNLLGGASPLSTQFMNGIRQYNAALAFTSCGAKIDRSVLDGRGAYAFRLAGGELYHSMGSLLPDQTTPTYAQLYIYDPATTTPEQHNENALNARIELGIGNPLQAILHDVNPYVTLYQQAFDVMSRVPPAQRTVVTTRLEVKVGSDKRRHNLPTAEEIAAILPGDGTQNEKADRDIVIRLEGGRLRRISQLNPLYSPLHYVLLFP
ncbi:hypothetical protein BDZ89DRAFT_964743, partial [Hymenopellis radicata]